jgi:hypothetical protein
MNTDLDALIQRLSAAQKLAWWEYIIGPLAQLGISVLSPAPQLLTALGIMNPEHLAAWNATVQRYKQGSGVDLTISGIAKQFAEGFGIPMAGTNLVEASRWATAHGKIAIDMLAANRYGDSAARHIVYKDKDEELTGAEQSALDATQAQLAMILRLKMMCESANANLQPQCSEQALSDYVAIQGVGTIVAQLETQEASPLVPTDWASGIGSRISDLSLSIASFWTSEDKE